MMNMAELIFFDQTRENGILETSIFKYNINLDTNELIFIDEYLSYDDSILDVKEKKSREFLSNSAQLVILSKYPQIPEFLPGKCSILNLSEIHGGRPIEELGELYKVLDKQDFLPNCLNYNLLNVDVFSEMVNYSPL